MRNVWFAERAMKSGWLCGLAAFTTALVATPAAAQDYPVSDYDDLGPSRRREYRESDQDVAVELRFGRYLPNPDQGLDDAPYARMFGDDNRYYFGAEVDWQLLRIPYLGTLAPGISFGYTKSSAAAPFEEAEGNSAQETTLEIFPMYLVAVLRADVIARETVVPLVPYGKLGMGFALWNISLGEKVTRVDGDSGRGLSFGPQFALGGMFLLDALDREDARTADSSIGLNHSYLFGEWYVSDLDGFNSRKRLNVGTNTWMAGVAVEF
jgi:hypothetical protein